MANYHPEYPANAAVDAGIKDFITNFYTVSDTFGKNQEWADFFRDDATLVMEKKEAKGKAGMCFLHNFRLCFPSKAKTCKSRYPQGARGHVGKGSG